MRKKILFTKSITKRRNFSLRIDLGRGVLEQYVREVIDCMEKDVLTVCRPLHPDIIYALGKWKKGSTEYEHAKKLRSKEKAEYLQSMLMDVRIRDWLSVGCQCIRFGVTSDAKKSKTAGPVACYESSSEVLWPVNGWHRCIRPAGPAAFVGEIIISHHLQKDSPEYNTPQYSHYFKHIISHELLHVFNYMRFVVPAFINWQVFWDKFLWNGMLCSEVIDVLEQSNEIIDRYGTKYELARLQEFWPSHAKKWLDGYRRYRNKKRKLYTKKKAKVTKHTRKSA